MLRIKLSPLGKKHQIHYRLVVMENRSKLTSSAIATLGHYHPQSKQLVIDRELLSAWIKKGAVPTLTVAQLTGI